MGGQTHTDYLNTRTFTSLDGLRAVSVIAVVWHHTLTRVPWLPMTSKGFLGVDAFFALSGFLIVTLLLRERDRHGEISLKAFYMRRSLRIFPLYFSVIAAVTIALSILAPQGRLYKNVIEGLPALLTYTSNIFPVEGVLAVTWSLAAEEQFYLLWPPVERLLRKYVGLVWVLALVVNQAANFSLLDPLLPEGYRHADLEILQATFTPILLGVGLAHTLHRPEGYARVHGLLSRPWVPWAMLMGLLALMNIPGNVSGLPRVGIHVLLIGLLASLLVRPQVPRPVLDSWAARRIGAVSYGIYLLHMLVAGAVKPVLGRVGVHSNLAFFVATMAGTWLISEVSFRVFESRFLKLKKHFHR